MKGRHQHIHVSTALTLLPLERHIVFPALTLAATVTLPGLQGCIAPFMSYLAEGVEGLDSPPFALLSGFPMNTQGDQVLVDGLFLLLPEDMTVSKFAAQKKEFDKA